MGDPSTASSIHHARLSLWSRGGGSTLHPHQSRDPQGYASPLPRCKGHRSHHQSRSFQFAHVNLVSLTATFCIIQYGLVIDQCMHPYCPATFLLLMSNTELPGDNSYCLHVLRRPCSPTRKHIIMMMTILLMILLPQVTLGAQLLSQRRFTSE